ncbi:5622_t:CDS:2, partial [Racocetra persica]
PFGGPIISDLIKTKQSKIAPNGKFVSLFQVEIGSGIGNGKGKGKTTGPTGPTGPQFINVAPDIITTEFVVASQFCKRSGCANRQNVFDSKSSKSFRSSFRKSNPIKYLDGSRVSGESGTDLLAFSKSDTKFRTNIILANQISGLLRTQAAVEGVMGLGAKSQIWNQLKSSRLDQVVGIALPLGKCDVGSIALGGLDTRFINGPMYNISLNSSKSTYSISINALYVGGLPINSTVVDSVIDTRNDRISLEKASREFFRLLKAKKSKSGGFVVPNPIDVSFDVILDDDKIVQLTLPNSTICDSNTGTGIGEGSKNCLSIFDDKSGPKGEITLGRPFLQ